MEREGTDRGARRKTSSFNFPGLNSGGTVFGGRTSSTSRLAGELEWEEL